MVYVPFLSDTPDITDTGAVVIDNTRENLMALRDSIVAGALKAWNLTLIIGGGTDETPDEIRYSNNTNTEAIRLLVTWGSSGGEEGAPTVVIYQYTPDDTPTITWDTIGTLTNTYNANGTLTASVWS